MTASLRELFARDEIVVAPGIYDGMTALLVERAGFAAAYLSGASICYTRYAMPDIGLVGMSEVADQLAAIRERASLPIIVDIDTGFGNALNVARTVRTFETIGASALQLEDQVTPKRCGHLDGKEIVPHAEFVSKIRAAVQARRNADFVIIARTDARAVLGFDEAIRRANAALEAGADMAFVEAPQTLDEVARVPRLVHGPCLLNMVAGGKTPALGLDDAQAMGYRMTILPGILFRNAIATFDRVLSDLAAQRRMPGIAGADTVTDGFRRFGLDAWNAVGTHPETSGERGGQ